MAARSKQLDGILGRAIAATPSKSAGSATVTPLASPAPAPAPALAVDLPSQTAVPAPEVPAKPQREKEVRLQIDVPEMVRRAIKARAVQDGESAREVILRALQKDGFDIPDDLIRDRRR